MNTKIILTKLSSLLLIVTVSLLLLLIPIKIISSSGITILSLSKKYSTQYTSHDSEQFHEDKVRSIMNYINSKREILDDTFFSPKDIIHLYDVRNLISDLNICLIVLVTTIISLIILIPSKALKIRAIKVGSYLNFAFLLLLIAAYILRFDILFIKLHEVFFKNEYWMLSYSDSMLIRYFPENVFKDLFFWALIIIIILNLFVQSSAIIFEKSFIDEKVTRY